MTLVRILIPFLIVAFLIFLVWFAIGIGNQLGNGLTEWTVR